MQLPGAKLSTHSGQRQALDSPAAGAWAQGWVAWQTELQALGRLACCQKAAPLPAHAHGH